MNKVMKYQIIKPVDCDWKTFGKVISELKYKTKHILNKCIQAQWEYNNFSSEYKQKYKVYPDSKEILGYSGSQAVQNYLKKQIKDEIRIFNSSNVDATLGRATSRWRTDKKDILIGEKSIPSFKKNEAIDVRNTSIKVYKENNSYYIDLSLISNEYKKELNRESGQFSVLIKVGDNTQKAILDRIISGEYKIAASQIRTKKIANKKTKKKENKVFVSLGYSFEPEHKELDKNNVMGIDMGVVYPVYMAFNNSLKRFKIEGGEIERFRNQVEKRKNQLYAQGKYCGNGRIGHGTLTRIKPIEAIGNKVSNFRDTTNHKYSRYVVDLAVKNNCGIIQMEDLSGIDKDNVFLKRWSRYDLQQKIKYKFEEYGGEVIFIDPQYTSQRCNECGYIDSKNRPKEEKGQAYFKCLKCNHEANADYNAAKNISTPNIDTIIKEYCKENNIPYKSKKDKKKKEELVEK